MDSENTGIEYSYIYIGMSGQDMTDALNANFTNTNNKIIDIDNELDVRIISNTIKYIRTQGGVVSYSEDNENWNSINVWGAIKGTLTDQTDLKNALGGKVSIESFNELSTKVNKNEQDILDISGNITNIDDEIDTIDDAINNQTTGIIVRLNNIDNTLTTKVSSPQIKAIRTTDGNHVDFTTDGTTWKSIFDGRVNWGNITGNISNQTDLSNLFNDIDNTIINIYGDLNSLDIRTSAIETYINNTNAVKYLTETNYRNLSPKESDTIYIVSPS